jgi:hypothetical protein
MTISFRAGEDEELYREFCDEVGIEYSALPKNIIEEVSRNQDTQDLVRTWINSQEESFISYLSPRETEEPQHEEAFDRIEAGLEYGLEDQVEEGLEKLEESGYQHTKRVKTLLTCIDDRYSELLQD